MKLRRLLFLLILFINIGLANAQSSNQYTGVVLNGFTHEPIPYASLKWKIAKTGVICDSVGIYTITKSTHPKDSIIIRYVGFEPSTNVCGAPGWLAVGFEPSKFSIKDIEHLNFKLTLENLSTNEGVTVKSKFNKGDRWWKQVVKNKINNNPYNYDIYI